MSSATPRVYSPSSDLLSPAGVMSMLRPLMLDVVPSIQQTAALALGRLADHSDDLAEAVVKEDILPQLVRSLASQNVSISSRGRISAGLPQTSCPVYRPVESAVCVYEGERGERDRRTEAVTPQDLRVSPLNARVCFGLTWQFAWGLLQNLRALHHESNQAFCFLSLSFSLSAHSEAPHGGRPGLVLVINGLLQSHMINRKSGSIRFIFYIKYDRNSVFSCRIVLHLGGEKISTETCREKNECLRWLCSF